jgi:polysaccharide export outer membrane protein
VDDGKEDSEDAVEEAADSLLEKKEREQLVMDVKTSSLLDQAELGLKVENIIKKRRVEENKENSYTVGPGDQLQISVRDHPELSGKTTIGPLGDLVLPLINQPVDADGLTLEELNEKVTEALKRYVKNPTVYVGIVTYKSKIFYFIDEQSCTPYTITRANFTVRDALFLSDWGQNRALGRVLLVRSDKLHPMVRKIDAFDMIYRGNLANNVKIEDGDVIYVPMTAASKIAQTIQDTFAPVKAFNDARKSWLNMRWNTDNGWSNVAKIPSNRAYEQAFNDDLSGNTVVMG